MHILLDHNLDWRLWELLQPHEVTTTKRMQWDRYENGDLLEVAQIEFDCLLTTDTNLYHQQKVANYDLNRTKQDWYRCHDLASLVSTQV